MPMIRLINDKYVYAFLQSRMTPSFMIFNRLTKENFYISQNAALNMFPCFALCDNVLIGILYPDKMDKYVDERAQVYMSAGTREKLRAIKEEDNPIIIKYYLKQ